MTRLFLLLCFCAFVGNAQTYSISPAKTVTFTAPFSNITISDIYQVNTGSSKIALTWETISINVPAGWGYSMCDLGTCYPGAPTGPTTMDSVPVNGQGFLGLNIDPDVIPGSGVVKVFVYQNGFKSNGDTLTWYVNTPAVSVEEINGNAGIKIFPNPVVSTLTVDLSNHQVKNGTITDVFGRKVMELSLNSGVNKFDLSSLSKGFYMLNLEAGEKQLFKRIIVE